MFSKELLQSSKESSSSTSRAKEYELQKCIGQGAYAKVYKAVHLPTKTKVAIKLYEKAKLTEKLRQKSIKREIKILSRLSHPNIVSFIDCFSTKNHIYLVMELVKGLSLYELLKMQADRKIKETHAKTIIKQVLKALHYCHSKCVSHRDIKLENIIISNTGEVKVIDFGFSTCIPNDKKVKMFCGTPSYMAPEIAQKTEYCGPPVDIWATGVLFFVLLSGKFPFKGTRASRRLDRQEALQQDLRERAGLRCARFRRGPRGHPAHDEQRPGQAAHAPRRTLGSPSCSAHASSRRSATPALPSPRSTPPSCSSPATTTVQGSRTARSARPSRPEPSTSSPAKPRACSATCSRPSRQKSPRCPKSASGRRCSRTKPQKSSTPTSPS